MLYKKEIFNSHPMGCDDPNRFKADKIAMELVGERYEKRDLVDLVRWLIMDKAETVVSDYILDKKG